MKCDILVLLYNLGLVYVVVCNLEPEIKIICTYGEFFFLFLLHN